jgi:phosphate transport system substrate-binding protein
MAVTELSEPGLADSLDRDSGIAVREDTIGHFGVIDLPKVSLNRGDHYKILAILQRSEGTGEYRPPIVQGGIKGGKVAETQSRTGASRVMLALTTFLVMVIIVQLTVAAFEPDPAPLECVAGKLTVVGSSAFAPVVKDAAEQYRKRCTGAEFAFGFEGTERGLDRLVEEGKENHELLAITDGPKGEGYSNLVSRALGLSLFSVVVHKDVGVRSLTTAQIEDIYQDRVTNWREVGGPDLPIVLVNRIPGSGTRNTFERRMLSQPQVSRSHVSCKALEDIPPAGAAHCDVQVTKDMLQAVAELRGAIGYSELSEAGTAQVSTVAVDGIAATSDAAMNRTYPFWGIEFAYSYGELPGDSLSAAFRRYLTDEAGRNVLAAHGNVACADLPDPTRCQPDV